MDIRKTDLLRDRKSALDMGPDEFKSAGNLLVDMVSDLIGSFQTRKITNHLKPAETRAILGEGKLPVEGSNPHEILQDIGPKLIENSLFNSHPRFWGYITSSAAPIGILGDFLASAINANVGAYALSPMATEIEKQVIRWLAEFIGYPETCEGVIVSGGNMANFVGFLAARKAMADWDVRNKGLNGKSMVLYCAKGTHTWVEKAADLFGLGTEAIRWINPDADGRMDIGILAESIKTDKDSGHFPFLVIGTAGSVSTGVVDPLEEISLVCKEHGLWFHIDGAYGALAAGLPENSEIFKGTLQADSIALDPHKWLYSPLEAGCVLVKKTDALKATFSFLPEYYNFVENQDDHQTNFYEYGMQNSRGFKALKVWLGLKHAGKNGYVQSIRQDIILARTLYDLMDAHPHFQVLTCHLSITTFRFVPEVDKSGGTTEEEYLNELNKKLLEKLQMGGTVYCSNAIIANKYCLRVCVVNFRTQLSDLEVLIETASATGIEIHKELSA